MFVRIFQSLSVVRGKKGRVLYVCSVGRKVVAVDKVLRTVLFSERGRRAEWMQIFESGGGLLNATGLSDFVELPAARRARGEAVRL